MHLPKLQITQQKPLSVFDNGAGEERLKENNTPATHCTTSSIYMGTLLSLLCRLAISPLVCYSPAFQVVIYFWKKKKDL